MYRASNDFLESRSREDQSINQGFIFSSDTQQIIILKCTHVVEKKGISDKFFLSLRFGYFWDTLYKRNFRLLKKTIVFGIIKMDSVCVKFFSLGLGLDYF